MEEENYDELLDRIVKVYKSLPEREQIILKQILVEIQATGESKTYKDLWLADYKEIPVDKYTFLTDDRFLGKTNNQGKSIYPVWMDTMLELEATGNQYYEIVFTGATRTGKSSTAVSDCAYQLYKLMCLRDPQAYYGLKSVTEISIFFFNLTEKLAKGVAFKEFNNTLFMSPWFLEHGTKSPSPENPIYIPEGGLIKIKFGSEASHALGQATFCVVFDEVNFSASNIKDINKAKASMKQKYDTLVARVTGTFVKNGEVFGKIYVISSKNSEMDFMEEYIRNQKEAGNKHMYIFDKAQWEVWPKSKYSSDKTFKIALGGNKLKSFVVPDDTTEQGLRELEAQGFRLIDVPEDNKTRFLSDFDVALRDIAGIAVVGQMAYITQGLIDACIGDRVSPFDNDIIAIGVKDSLTIEEFFHTDRVPRDLFRMDMFIHLDLSLNGDRTGISGVVVSGRKDIKSEDGATVSLPTLTQVFSIALEAPRDDKIPYEKILAFINWLRRVGFNIRAITRDQFQSEYIAQLLEGNGFGEVKKISLDRTNDGYMALRSVIAEERIDMLNVNLLINELIHLQRDPITQKIDHPVTGSKDVADSFAGAVWNAILTNPGVPIEVKKVANAISYINSPSFNNQGLPSVFYMDPRYRK